MRWNTISKLLRATLLSVPGLALTGTMILCQPSVPYREVEVMHGGTIHGFVRLADAHTTAGVFEITKDATCCGRTKSSPRLIVGKNGGIKYALVFLDGIRSGKKFTEMNHVRLTQEHCEYSPHVALLRLGADLEISNSDPVLHNIHGYSLAKTPGSLFNIAQPVRGQRSLIRGKQLNTPGIVETTCDAGHPWMSGYIVVLENPYACITDDKGEFTIPDIPPGRYVLRLWHEGVAVERKEVEAGKVKKYYFEDPYEEKREIDLAGNGTLEENFTLTLR